METVKELFIEDINRFRWMKACLNQRRLDYNK